MAEFKPTPEQIKASAAMAVDVSIGCDSGDPVKMIGFIIDEFAIVMGGNILNVDDVAAIIGAAVEELRQRGSTQ